MDLNYINKNLIIDRYILGQLSEQELVEFELYYLENPKLVEKIDLQRALIKGLRTESTRATKLKSLPKTSFLTTISGWFQSPVLIIGNFATIALLASVISFELYRQPPPIVIADQLWVGQVRSQGRPVPLQLKATRLILNVELPTSGQYDIELLDSNGSALKRFDTIKAEKSLLSIVVESKLLKSQIYQLNVYESEGTQVLSREIAISR